MKSYNDLGLGSKAPRLLNADGSFNVKRKGIGISTVNLYQHLTRMGWIPFLSIIFTTLVIINVAFALVYLWIGIDHFSNLESINPTEDFLNCLHFSFQTFTTVGYGFIAPEGHLISFIASLEAMSGWMVFAIITGLLYGRFAKPSAKILFSNNLLVSPHGTGDSLQFRVVNKRKSVIMDLHARMLMSYAGDNGTRSYLPLELERQSVLLFPLNWTVVHPIAKDSPLHGKTQEELVQMDAQFIIVLKGYDDTFSQEINAIHAYEPEDMIWHAKFEMMYMPDKNGSTELDMRKLNDIRIVKKEAATQTA